MKNYIQNVHSEDLKKLIGSKLYMQENAWLDMTSFWSIKDIERRAKTFPVMAHKDKAVPAQLLEWIIMDVKRDDPHVKSNKVRVPIYDSLEWKFMIDLDCYTIKKHA